MGRVIAAGCSPRGSRRNKAVPDFTLKTASDAVDVRLGVARPPGASHPEQLTAAQIPGVLFSCIVFT